MHDALFFPPQGFLFFHHAEQFWQVQTEIAGILQVILIRHLPEMEEAVLELGRIMQNFTLPD